MKAQSVSPAVREQIHARSGGTCEICGQRRAEEIHHRLGRQMGGSREPWINLAGNLLHLCSSDHHMVTVPKLGKTEKYRSLGWLVRRGVRKPSEIPVYIWHDWLLAWWLLHDDGTLSHPTVGERAEASMLAAFHVPLDDDSDRYHDRTVDEELMDDGAASA